MAEYKQMKIDGTELIRMRCFKCNRVKPEIEFDLSKMAYGKQWCRECYEGAGSRQEQVHREKHQEWGRDWYYRNRDTVRAKQKDYKKRYRPTHRRKNWAWSSYKLHKRLGYEILFSPKDLEEMAEATDTCYICGRMLDWGPKGGRTQPNSPTLDRVTNEKVLALGNVRICCNECNVSKFTRTLKEFIAYCRKVSQNLELEKLAEKFQNI